MLMKKKIEEIIKSIYGGDVCALEVELKLAA